jgi:hypothetical protein
MPQRNVDIVNDPGVSDARSYWLRQAAEDCERAMAEEDLVPDTRQLPLHRYRTLLQYTAALALAVIASLVSLLAVFFAVNVFLHIGAE